MEKSVRLGVWGCGGHAINHLEHMPSRDLVHVVAVFDLDNTSMTKAKMVLGDVAIVLCGSVEEMLSLVDAVYIATPDYCHAKQIEVVLAAGKHVVAEKPLAIDEEQLLSVHTSSRFAATNDLIFLTCHPRRFDPRNDWLRRNLRRLTDKYGMPTAFSFEFFYPAPKDAWKEDRGLLMDHVNHEVDLMGYILGAQYISARRLRDTALEYEVIGRREEDAVFFRFAGKRTKDILDWDHAVELMALYFRDARVEVRDREPFVREYGKAGEILAEHHIPLRHHFDQYGEVIANFARAVRHEEVAYVSPYEMLLNTKAGVLLTNGGFISYSFTD